MKVYPELLKEAEAMLEEDLYSFRKEAYYLRRRGIPKSERNLRLCRVLEAYRQQKKREEEGRPLINVYDKKHISHLIKLINKLLKHYGQEIRNNPRSYDR